MSIHMSDVELTARCEGSYASNEPFYDIYSAVAGRNFTVRARTKQAARITLCDYHIRILGLTDTHLADLVVSGRVPA